MHPSSPLDNASTDLDVNRLLMAGVRCIHATPAELRFSDCQEFEPFALLDTEGGLVAVDAPYLCAQDMAVAAGSWDDLLGQVIGRRARAALVAQPVWVAPKEGVRAKEHPGRQEHVVLTAIGGDGRGQARSLPVDRESGSPRLRDPIDWEHSDAFELAPRLGLALTEVEAASADQERAPTSPTAASSPDLPSAEELLAEAATRLDTHLNTGAAVHVRGFVETLTPNGRRQFASQGQGAELEWALGLPQLVRETAAEALLLSGCEVTESGHDRPSLRLHALDAHGTQALAVCDLGPGLFLPKGIGDWRRVAPDTDLTRAVMSTLGRVRQRREAFELALTDDT